MIEERIKILEKHLQNCLLIARLQYGKDFRAAAAHYGDFLRDAESSLIKTMPRLQIATNEDGWLCPNCLRLNESADEPKKDDILNCSICGHITLIEE